MSRFTVELLRENLFDYLLIGECLNLPLWYRKPLSAALSPYREDVHIAEPVKWYAKSAAANADLNTLWFLTALTREIYQTFRQTVRLDGLPWSSDLTLSRMEGYCRDLAVLFCDACRVMGIAARFVSGYDCASAGSQESPVSNTHVALAAGFDPDLASSLAGWYSGGSQSLRLQVDDVSKESG